MGFFDRLKHKDINQGVKDTSQPRVRYYWMSELQRNIERDIFPKVKMCHCRQLIEFHLLLRGNKRHYMFIAILGPEAVRQWLC